jgi:ankyrin repeat protein
MKSQLNFRDPVEIPLAGGAAVAALLQLGADVASVDRTGVTALHVAAAHGAAEVVGPF